MKITCSPARTVRQFRELMETDPEDVQFVRNEKDWDEFSRGADSKDHPLEPLTSEDIAHATLSALEAPPHVAVNEILIRPVSQPR